VVGDTREQLTRLVQQVLEGSVGRLEELGHRPPVGDAQRPLLGEVVDEVAVPQIGGDAAGRSVRLGDVPLPLEHGHVVAHGCARHAELAGAGDPLGPDRLRRLDVLLDHGPQDRGLAFVEIRWIRRSH
jgi:hypothetical protein